MVTGSLTIRHGVLRNYAVLTNPTAIQGSRRYRWLHTKPGHQVQAYGISSAPITDSIMAEPMNVAQKHPSRLPSAFSAPPSATSHLSFPALLRTYLMTAGTSSPLLITPSIWILSRIAYSKSFLLSPDKNPVLHWLLKHTVYRQFCAGENATEVQATIHHLQSSGIKGIILCYAREVELRGNQQDMATKDTAAEAETEINSWAKGIMETLRIVPEDNFVSIKFSGAGALTLHCLQNSLPPPPLLAQHLQQICKLAHSKRIKICVDAEQSTFQPGIDAWTLDLQRQFNTSRISDESDAKPWACIYSTYQTYLRSAPAILSRHLQIASQESFALGVKLVRGAYLSSEPRSLFWNSKEETDTCYDTLAQALISRSWQPLINMIKAVKEADSKPNTQTYLQSTSKQPPFPAIGLVLATHNLQSCRIALSQRQDQASHNEPRIDMVYAQLQGMADHVTGELVNAAIQAESASKASLPTSQASDIEVPLVCKYLTWGSVGECSKYLVRRAEENRDAVARTVEARRALGREVWRRIWRFGSA